MISVKLQDCCRIITDGVHNTPPLTDKGIPLLDGTNIKGFKIDDSSPKKYITLKTDNEISKRCKPSENDILLSSRGSIGKIAIVGPMQNFNIMGNIILIRTTEDSLYHRYIAYYLHYKKNHLENISRGVAQKGLYLNCLLYTSPSPRDVEESRMPSSA